MATCICLWRYDVIGAQPNLDDAYPARYPHCGVKFTFALHKAGKGKVYHSRRILSTEKEVGAGSARTPPSSPTALSRRKVLGARRESPFGA